MDAGLVDTGRSSPAPGRGGALRGTFGKKQPGIDSNSSVRAEGSTFQGVYEEGTLCPSR